MNGPLAYRLALVFTELTDSLEGWIQLALRLAPPECEIHLYCAVQIPEDKSLSEGAMQAQQWRDHLTPFAQAYPSIYDDIKVRVDYRPLDRILDELRQQMVNLLVVQWAGPLAQTGGISTDDLLERALCDVALVCGKGWQLAGPVLLALRGGPNISLGVQMAQALAGEEAITLFHATDNRRAVPDLSPLMQATAPITRTVMTVGSIERGLLEEAPHHKVIVVGGALHQSLTQTAAPQGVIERLYQNVKQDLVLVHAFHPESLEFHAPRLRAPVIEDLSTRVDRWFAENTFHSREFADLQALLALKEKQGLTISIGLPALNEEATVGEVICTVKQALMDDVPLVDEIVLIDSNSTDRTVAIAEELGIPVYKHPEILPEVGSYRGKGEALWKSLHVLKGDIIAWIDTDITNIHPRFIYGLLGPLLKRPDIQYVKGFYRRPIQVGEELQVCGGGRVTELVVRPLFNLFYPELSGLAQPLSGEYAGRRVALEQMPFFTGYGVETGLLIDLYNQLGLGALAQTDLEVRVHRNQPLVGLSKMSFAILQVFIARMESRYGTHLLDKVNRSMKLVAQEAERFALDVVEIGDAERPPMATLQAYQARRRGS
jgi:glucosyl-3-phosphoglycerate synthase